MTNSEKNLCNFQLTPLGVRISTTPCIPGCWKMATGKSEFTSLTSLTLSDQTPPSTKRLLTGKRLDNWTSLIIKVVQWSIFPNFERVQVKVDWNRYFSRCTTVYLTDRRIDMLPLLLSSNLCSLRGGVERFAFSCIWEIEPETANVISTKFTKSIIKSKLAMVIQSAFKYSGVPI